MGLSTQWYKVIWASQCFLIQNQKVGLKDVNAEFAVDQMRFILTHKKTSFQWREIKISLLSYVYHVHLEFKCSITPV